MRIRKKENSIGLLGKILNNKSSGNTNDTYSCNYIDNGLSEIKTKVNTGSIVDNFNNAKSRGIGIFYIESNENNPASSQFYSLVQNVIGNWVFQQATDFITNRTYTRQYNQNTGLWTKWQEITTTYLEEETIVGTLNGKPVYRKVIQGVFTCTENSDTFIAGFDFDFSIVSFKGIVKSSNGLFWPIPNYYSLNSEYWCTVYQQGRGVYINGGKKYENSRFHLIIEYIKTTD